MPQTSIILSPYFHSKIKYVDQYIDILIQRRILNTRKRLIKYNPQKTYHTLCCIFNNIASFRFNITSEYSNR